MSDGFTPRSRDRWLSGLAADREMADAAVRVGLALTLRRNRATGRCDPSVECLAADTGRSERSVARDLVSLESRGWIRRTSTRGRYKNSYSFEFPATLTEQAGFNHDTPDRVDPDKSDGVDPDTPDRVEGANPDKMGDPTLTECVVEPCHCWQTEPDLEPGKENQKESISVIHDGELFPPETAVEATAKRVSRSAKSGTAEIDQAFAEFWSEYPRRKARGTAERAFAAAVKAGTEPELIIAGARRYAAERVGQNPTFTKHPATWLNAKAWLDEPEEPPTWTGSASGSSPGRNSSTAIVDEMLAGVGMRRFP